MNPILHPPSPGQPITAELIRRMIEAIAAQRVTAGVGLRIDERPGGAIISLAARSAGAHAAACPAPAWSVVETETGRGVYVPEGALTLWLENAMVKPGKGIGAAKDAVMPITLTEVDDPKDPKKKKAADTEIWLVVSFGTGTDSTSVLTTTPPTTEENATESDTEQPATLNVHIATILADGTLDQRHTGCLELACIATDTDGGNQETLEANLLGRLQLRGADAENLGGEFENTLLDYLTPVIHGEGEESTVIPGPGIENTYAVLLKVDPESGRRVIDYIPIGTADAYEEPQEPEDPYGTDCDDHPGDNDQDSPGSHPGDGHTNTSNTGNYDTHPGDTPDWCGNTSNSPTT